MKATIGSDHSVTTQVDLIRIGSDDADAEALVGMAKEPGERYGTCQEMIAAAASALSLPEMAEHETTAGGGVAAFDRTRTMWAQPPRRR
jgi:hypothetical protein